MVTGHRAPSFSVAASTTLVVGAVLAAACGSSSHTTATAPSLTKCALQVTADTPSFPPAGGAGSLRITANRDCAWTARTDAPWLTIAQPADGHGEGSVGFSVGANGDAASRTAGITINDQRVDVSQAGKPCEFTVSSNHETAASAGGELSVVVRATMSSCAWTVTSGVPWISIAPPRERLGDGTVTFHVDALTGPPRTGNLIIAGQTVLVDQGTACVYAVSVDTLSIGASGGERQIAVTAPTGCSWTAQSQTTWITVASGGAGSGPGIVVLRVAPSDGPGRSGTVIVAGRTIAVTQSLGCTYSIAPPSLSVSAQASSQAIQVEAGPGCAWAAASGAPWVTIASGGSGSGRGQVQLAIAANDGPARTGTVTIAGGSLSVTQANGCVYSVDAPSQEVGGDGGNVVASVATGAGCSWVASSAVDWITVAPASGTGTGRTTLTVKPNASPPRTGRVVVAGRTLTLAQASLCRWSFAPESHEFPASGGNGNVLVFVTGACSWTAVSNSPWIQITAGSSGTGAALLQFVVPANPGPARTGTIAIGGEDYVVHQAGTGELRSPR